MDKQYIEILVEKILQKGKVVFFTGAGISTESGIKDYRSQGGIWDKFKPVYFDEFMAKKESRIEYWRRKTLLNEEMKNAKPNSAHIALTKLNELGLLEVVITQNIDGLHQLTGLPDDKIIELHGNTTKVRCMTCSNISPLEDAIQRIKNGDLAPECQCGGYLKPDTISFGQSMPEEKVLKAVNFSKTATLFIAIGSTLVVQPAASMPLYAKQNNAFFCIINLSKTPYDDQSDLLIRDKAGEVMGTVINYIEKKQRMS